MTANISQFLEIFKQALSGDEDFKEDVCAIVIEKTGFLIDKKFVYCKNGRIQIKTDTYTKTEINLHREEILKAVQLKYPKKNIREII